MESNPIGDVATNPVEKQWTVAELEQHLEDVKWEIQTIGTQIKRKPSKDDLALYRERLEFLTAALAQLPDAIRWAKTKEGTTKSGYHSMDIKF